MESNKNIKLYWTSLKNEIDAETWKSAKCYITEEKAEERAEAQTGDDTLGRNYCYRKIEQAIMQIEGIAHKFFREYERWVALGNMNDLVNGDVMTVVKGGMRVSFVLNHRIGNTYYDKNNEGYVIDNNTCKFVEGYHKVSANDEADNKLRKDVVWWGLGFAFSGRQNVNMALLVARLHKYVVLSVLQEWSKVTVPSLTKEYVDRMSVEEALIKEVLYRKEEPDWDE